MGGPARDVIAEARVLADRLDRAGQAEAAAAVRDAIDYAATGSEILTGLRYHLHQAAAHADVPDDVRAAATELASAIHAVLVR